MGAPSLSKFGPPLAGLGNRQIGLLQPKQRYRFRVRTANFGPIDSQDNFTHNLITATRPKLTYKDVEVHSYNSIAYYAGKHEWSPMTVELRDDISNNASRLVAAQLQKQLNVCQMQGVPAGVNYKFSMFLETLDGQSAVPFERWTIEGAFVQDVDYDKMDYADSNFLKITLTIRFDQATYTLMDEFGTIEQSNSILTAPFAPGARNGVNSLG